VRFLVLGPDSVGRFVRSDSVLREGLLVGLGYFFCGADLEDGLVQPADFAGSVFHGLLILLLCRVIANR